MLLFSNEIQLPHETMNETSYSQLFNVQKSSISRAPLRVHVSQADGRLLFQDVQALGLLAGDRNCGYSSRSQVPRILAT